MLLYGHLHIGPPKHAILLLLPLPQPNELNRNISKTKLTTTSRPIAIIVSTARFTTPASSCSVPGSSGIRFTVDGSCSAIVGNPAFFSSGTSAS